MCICFADSSSCLKDSWLLPKHKTKLFTSRISNILPGCHKWIFFSFHLRKPLPYPVFLLIIPFCSFYLFPLIPNHFIIFFSRFALFVSFFITNILYGDVYGLMVFHSVVPREHLPRYNVLLGALAKCNHNQTPRTNNNFRANFFGRYYQSMGRAIHICNEKSEKKE